MTRDRIGGLVFVGVGAYACYASVDMSIGSLRAPGPGLYPLVFGITLTVLALALAGANARSRHVSASVKLSPSSPRQTIVLATIATLAAYAGLLAIAGFGAATFLVLTILFRFGDMRWPGAALLSLALTAGTIAVARLISIPLPGGMLFS